MIRHQFSGQKPYALSEPLYDQIKVNSYLEMYDSILSPQMLNLHEMSLKKCIFLSKNGYLSVASDWTKPLRGNLCLRSLSFHAF